MFGFTFLIITFLIFVFVVWKKKTSKLLPGPTRWPILGSIPQMFLIDKKYPHLQISGIAKNYDGIFSLGFGVHYAVVISSYEIMKDLLRRNETNMERYQFQFTSHRSQGKNLGIIWSYGDVWNEQRKLTVKRLREFGFGKSKSIEQTLQEEMDYLMADMKRSSINGIWEVDQNRLQASAVNVLWSSVGGYRFDPDSHHVRMNLKLIKEFFEAAGPSNLLSLFPFLKVFPNLSGYNKHEEIYTKHRGYAKELLEDAKLKRQGRIEPESFVEVYLDEIEKNSGDTNSNTTEEQLLMIITDLFLAGADTTGTVIHWAILYFALNPNIQSKARQEIYSRTNDGASKPSLKMANSEMPYIKAFILEIMRHSPFGPMPPPRCASEDIQYGEYVIPKGTLIIFFLYSVFHDKKFWGDPERFRPERYFDETGTKLVTDKVERVCQFGFGKRACPGELMAMDTLFLFVTTLLSEFEIQVVPGMEPNYEPGEPALALAPRPFSVKLIVNPLHLS